MNPHFPSYSVICTHFGDPAITTATLVSLRNSTEKPQKIVVIDHGEKPYILPISDKTITVVRPATNEGYGAGSMLGLGVLTGQGLQIDDAVVIMNNDLTIHPEALQQILKAHQQNPHALVGIRLGSVDFFSGRTTLKQPRASWKSHLYLDGALVIASLRTWALLKGFPQQYFLYWEDVALSERARHHNVPLVCVSTDVTHHSEATLSPERAEKTYYLVRNGAFFLETETPPLWRLFWYIGNRVRYIWHTIQHSPMPVRYGLRDAIYRRLGKISYEHS